MNGPPYVTHDEFETLRREIETRLHVFTGEVDGEKAVTRHILEQSRRNGEDLGSIKSRLDRAEARIDRMAGDIVVIRADVGHHGRKLDVMAQDLRLIRTMLEQLRDRDEPDGK
jgi:DNA repair ATPase RecN